MFTSFSTTKGSRNCDKLMLKSGTLADSVAIDSDAYRPVLDGGSTAGRGRMGIDSSVYINRKESDATIRFAIEDNLLTLHPF